MKRSELKQIIREVIKEETLKKKRLNEVKYTVDDFPVGAIVKLKNGEEWLVAKSSSIATSGNPISRGVMMQPYNAKAKSGNISISSEWSIDFLNKSGITSIKTK